MRECSRPSDEAFGRLEHECLRLMSRPMYDLLPSTANTGVRLTAEAAALEGSQVRALQPARMACLESRTRQFRRQGR